MNTLPPQSVRCPTLIGRSAHLATLDHLLAHVAAGQGQTLLIAGEAGMGKSRLVAELRQRTGAPPWQTLTGLCTPIEQGMPYAPLLDLLRQFPTDQHSPPAELALLTDGLMARLATSGMPSGSAPASELDKYHLYHLVLAWIQTLAQSGPRVLVFEDLHWSDEATLELLPYLAQRLSTQPVLLACTYRNDETGPALTRCLAALDRLSSVHEARLAPLSRTEVEQMLRAIFGQQSPVRAPFLDALYTLTEGNPFYIEESLKSMVMAGDLVLVDGGVWTARPLDEFHIPRSARAAVQQRSERVSEEARTVLTLAAVAGRHFDFGLLQRLAALDETTLLARLRELIDAQFLEEESADRFVFRHALTRQCIYATVMARERRMLHAAIAAELETLYGDRPDVHLADLAYHNHAGERWEAARRYAEQAGDHALALFAPQMAVEQFTRAIEATHQLGDQVSTRLLRQRGHAHALLGDFSAARQDYVAALDGTRADHDPTAEWALLIDLAQLWMTQDYARGGDYLNQAYALAQQMARPGFVAHSLNALGNWAMNQGRPYEAVRYHQEAYTLFGTLGDAQGIAQTLDLLAIASYNCGDIAAGRAYYREVLPRWRALQDRRGLLHTLSGLGLAVDFDLEVNEVPVAQHLAWAEEGVNVARGLGWQAGLVLTLICAALAKRHQGLPGSALNLLHEALTLAEDIAHKEWTADARVALGATLLDLLAPDAAQDHLTTALAMARAMDSMIWIGHASMALAAMYTQRQDFAQADAVLDAVLTAETPLTGLQNRGLWFARAELALARGEPDEALAITSRLLPAQPAPPGEPAPIVPRLGLLHGRTLLALGRLDEAAVLLDACRAATARQGRNALLWRINAACAAVYDQRGDTAAAQQARAAANEIVDAIAADAAQASHADAQSLADHFREAAAAMLSTSRPHATPESHSVLTPRERAVAALVAQGLTNRAIAETLVLSERTAERHIANIMNKLGMNTRAQVAAWYVAQRTSV